MEWCLLGWPEDGPTVRLDHRRFSYAGKFVMSSTGKAVARDDGEVVAAVAFDEDRTDPDTLVIRYVTVREDHRGRGIGPDLVGFLVDAARDRGYGRVRIAVNNPFAYQALYRAGFAFTGEESGLAELVLARPTAEPASRDPDRYREGLDHYAGRDLTADERAFVESKLGEGPPAVDRREG